MKHLFDTVSEDCSKIVTQSYSTSFSMATKMLHPSIRNHVYNVYGFVRFADEIVDSFHEYPKEELLDRFEADLYHGLDHKISLNPILNAFQKTVNAFDIDRELIAAFMRSMRWDLEKKVYETRSRIQRLHLRLCRCCWFDVFKIFVKGNTAQYESLKTCRNGVGLCFSKSQFSQRPKR